MKCHICGSEMAPIVTDLPFKVTKTATVIIRDLPALQCPSCGESLLDDSVLQRVEEMLGQAGTQAELVIVRYPS